MNIFIKTLPVKGYIVFIHDFFGDTGVPQYPHKKKGAEWIRTQYGIGISYSPMTFTNTLLGLFPSNSP